MLMLSTSRPLEDLYCEEATESVDRVKQLTAIQLAAEWTIDQSE